MKWKPETNADLNRRYLIPVVIEALLKTRTESPDLFDERVEAFFEDIPMTRLLPDFEHIPNVPFPSMFDDLTTNQTMLVLWLMELMRENNKLFQPY